MILEFLSALSAGFLVSLLGYVIVLGANNRRKYQFFKKNAPGLKVLKNPSLFGGHSSQFVYAKYNWALGEKNLEEDGPTVGFYLDNRPAVFTTDLDFIKTFIVDEPIHTNRMKPGLPLRELEEDSIMFAEDEQWLRIRKAVGPAFTAHKIKLPNVQSDINRTIDKVVGLIDRRLDEAKQMRQENSIEENVEDICHRYSLDLVFTNFYKQNNVVDFYSKEDKYVSLIERNLKDLIGFFAKASSAFPLLRNPLNWLILNFHEQGIMRNTIMNYIKQQTRNNFEATKQAQEIGRKKVGNLGKIVEGQEESYDKDISLKDGSKFRRNMIDYVTDQYREGKLTKSEYFNSTFFLFFAGDKTTADGLSRLFHNLACHQDVQEKLRESILASGIDSEYLTWVIHETLRMNPPVPIGCSRVIKRDIQTKHGLVPAGTFVVTPARTIGRLKEYWGDDADDFRPERWADAKNFHPVQYLAFGAGKRGCPGRELALMEIKMLFNVLMRRYKFEKSTIHTNDNSELYTAPIFAFVVFDTPTYVRISRLES